MPTHKRANNKTVAMKTMRPRLEGVASTLPNVRREPITAANRPTEATAAIQKWSHPKRKRKTGIVRYARLKHSRRGADLRRFVRKECKAAASKVGALFAKG